MGQGVADSDTTEGLSMRACILLMYIYLFRIICELAYGIRIFLGNHVGSSSNNSFVKVDNYTGQ